MLKNIDKIYKSINTRLEIKCTLSLDISMNKKKESMVGTCIKTDIYLWGLKPLPKLLL